MAVSMSLQNGSWVLAWQTADSVNFELADANGNPVGNSVTVANGPSVWTSIAPLSNGGFSIIWDSAAGAQPMAQDYGASGIAAGAAHALSGPPPAASMASTSLEPAIGNDSGPWTTLLPNGDTIVVSSQDQTGPGAPQLLMQQFDPAGHQVGSDYADVQQGLPGLGKVQTAALANGGYVVTFTDNGNYGAALDYDLFRADGTHLAARNVAIANYQLIPTHATASLPDGGFVMSWVAASYNAAPFTVAPFAVFAEEFGSDGSAATAPQMLGVLANNYTDPVINALPNGKYTISWTSGGTPQAATFSEQGTPVPNNTNDTISTPAPAYTLPIGPHNVTLVGSAAQTVTGNSLGDKIVSNDSASTLIGGQGNDTLVAGHGANILTGGGGADNFVYPVLPWNAGHITDFDTAQDKIDVSAILKTAGYGGTDPFGDKTLTLNADSHGGTELVYHPPGAGSNGIWPVNIVDIDNVAPSALNAGTDFVTGYTASTGGGAGSGGTSTGGGGTTTAGSGTLTANDTAGQHLTATAPNATFIVGHNSVVMTEDGGANDFVFNALPWNAGQITNFSTAQDKIDVSAILKTAGYAGAGPFGDGTLTLNSDGHGGTDLIYHPPGAGTNGHWPVTIVDIDNVTPSQFNIASDFVTGGTSTPGGTSGGTAATGSGTTGTSTTGTGSGTAQTLTANDTAGQLLTATAPNDNFIAGHNSVVMTEDGGANNFVFNALPWNAGQITNFNPASDKIDVSAILTGAGYAGSDPFGDGTLSLGSDGRGGSNLAYHPPGAGANGIWPITIVDIDHVAATQFQASDWVFHH
jgi:Ca2+-binding RTX toxin-like protein